MASKAKAKVGALFINSQDAIPLRNTLIELGHPQPPTPIQTNNSTAAGFANAPKQWTCVFTGSRTELSKAGY
jgi:hypothetical protein